MSQLTAEQIIALAELLDTEERSLAAVIDEHVAGLRASSTPETTTLAGDVADQADIDLLRDRQNAAVERDLRSLRDIEAARSRLADGTIGSCIDCADEIGFERLLVHPTASRCMLCQDSYEQSHSLAPDQAS